MATDGPRRPSAFGQLLKQWRSGRGLTQEELAERAGVSARLISDLERGIVQRPRRDTAAMLADALALDGEDREGLLGARQEAAAARSELEPRSPWPAGFGLASSEGLLGRDQELPAIIASLTSGGHRLVTLTGMGGVGKTRLALEATRLLRDAYPDGLYVVDLAPLRDGSLILPAIATAAGVQRTSDEPLMPTLAGTFRNRSVLLIVDNLEHLPDAAGVVANLIANVPGVTLLATSREPLRLRGELELPVEPLPVPDPRNVSSASELGDNPAVALLARRAAAVRPSFAVTAENAAAIAEIVQRLDGVPLAIELIAARLRTLSPADLVRLLERRLPLLTMGPRDAPARHQTMSAAIDWSYQLLSAFEQVVYRRFAVFDGGATLDAVSAICGHDLAPNDLLDLIQSLVEKHLVRSHETGDGTTRFRMLETVREHALDRLAESGDEDETRAIHASWCLRFAEHAKQELIGSDQERWVRAIEQDHDNLRAALRRAIATEDADLAQGIAAGLIRFWVNRGYLLEALGWFDVVLALGNDRITEAHAEALLGAGVISCFLSDYATAKQQTERAFAVFEQMGDLRGMGSSFGNLGLIADVQGQFDEASGLYHRALERFRQVGDVTQSGYMLGNLGMIAYDTGDYAQAMALHQEALGIWRQLGDSDAMAHVLSGLGQSAAALGNFEQATRLQIESLELRESIGHESGIAKCLECLAQIAQATGSPERAAWLLGAAQAIRERTGARSHPVDIAALDHVTESTREALGRRTFTHAWNAGSEAPRETVLTVAIDGAALSTTEPILAPGHDDGNEAINSTL